jgi:putative membrane protein
MQKRGSNALGLFDYGCLIRGRDNNFVFQNVEVVTMSFLGLSVRAPLAVLAAVAYILGTVTGGSLFALLRKSVQGSRASRP